MTLLCEFDTLRPHAAYQIKLAPLSGKGCCCGRTRLTHNRGIGLGAIVLIRAIVVTEAVLLVVGHCITQFCRVLSSRIGNELSTLLARPPAPPPQVAAIP